MIRSPKIVKRTRILKLVVIFNNNWLYSKILHIHLMHSKTRGNAQTTVKCKKNPNMARVIKRIPLYVLLPGSRWLTALIGRRTLLLPGHDRRPKPSMNFHIQSFFLAHPGYGDCLREEHHLYMTLSPSRYKTREWRRNCVNKIRRTSSGIVASKTAR